ncbi:ricin B lectin domain-containing protein [Mycena galericulata]|nr:ricin B lectin domain-containing protein [Mycena galericulata]
MIVSPERRPGAYSISGQTSADVDISNISGVNNLNPLSEGIYTVTNSRQPVVMELSEGDSRNGTAVQAYENAPITSQHLFNQLWLVQLTSTGHYSFRNLRGGTYMDLLRGNAANYSKIVGYEAQGPDGGASINQEWEVIQAGEFYKIRNRNSKTYVNLRGGRSGNGTEIMGFADTAGTPSERDELWKFTLRSVTLSDVHTVLERCTKQVDDMHVVSLNRFLFVPPPALLAHLWRETPHVSIQMLRKSVFSDQCQMGFAFKTAVTMWAAQHIKANDISILFGLVRRHNNGEACNWTLNEDHSSILFLSPTDGSIVTYANEYSSWGFF